MADNKFKNLFKALNESLEPEYKGAQFAQGQDVPLKEREYDAPREIAGPPKPIEAVVPRMLTDSIMGAPGTAAGILRMMYDYYPEKFNKTTKTETKEAALPEWFLTAITDPNFRNTEQGKKAIEYAQKRLQPQEKLIRRLAQREEDMLRANTNKYITPFEKIPKEIPLADEGFKLVQDPKSYVHEQGWDLDSPIGRIKNWVNINRDFENVPSVGFLKELPQNLKGNALAAQAYTQLAKHYGTLRSDATGATSPMIKRSFWNQFGQPFEHEFGGGFGSETRFEAPFKHNLHELNKPIRERYKQLGEQATEEVDLLRNVLGKERNKSGGLSEEEFWNLGKPDHIPGASEPIPFNDNEGFGYIDPNKSLSPGRLVREENRAREAILKLPIEKQKLINEEYMKLGKQFPEMTRANLMWAAHDTVVPMRSPGGITRDEYLRKNPNLTSSELESLAEMGPRDKITPGPSQDHLKYQQEVINELRRIGQDQYTRGKQLVEKQPGILHSAIYNEFDKLRELDPEIPYDQLMEVAIANINKRLLKK